MDEMHLKYENLRAQLCEMGTLAVAFSGGVDSTFLLKAAHETLGDGVLAITAAISAVPEWEQREAESWCRTEGIRQIVVPRDLLQIEAFRTNPPDRCYHCKRQIFEKLWAIARAEGMHVLAEGSNADDESDYRPGMRAIAELGVASPLRTARLRKHEIRALSKELGLPTWDKPSYACLASRIAYGEPITDEKLEMVDRAEQLLRGLGFSQLRVRMHGRIARIELTSDAIPSLMADGMRQHVYAQLKALGFDYVAADLAGYRTGSMNEVLTAPGDRP